MSDCLKLMQFNLENFFLYLDNCKSHDLEGMNETHWQDLTHSAEKLKPLKKAQEIAELILRLVPDIVLCCEMGGLESAENFCKLFLKSKYEAHLIEGNSNRGIDVGYLIRKDLKLKTLLISHKDRPINFLYEHEKNSEKKTHYFSRDVAELRIFGNDGQSLKLVLLGVHLKSKLDLDGVDPFGKSRRAAEFKTLLEIYSEVVSESTGKVPIVIGGDFNGIASSLNTETEFKSLYDQTQLIDVLEISSVEPEQRVTQVTFDSLGKAKPIQIDYFFIDQKFKNLVVTEQTKVFRFEEVPGIEKPLPLNIDQRAKMPSDHYPVLLGLKITF